MKKNQQEKLTMMIKVLAVCFHSYDITSRNPSFATTVNELQSIVQELEKLQISGSPDTGDTANDLAKSTLEKIMGKAGSLCIRADKCARKFKRTCPDFYQNYKQARTIKHRWSIPHPHLKLPQISADNYNYNFKKIRLPI